MEADVSMSSIPTPTVIDTFPSHRLRYPKAPHPTRSQGPSSASQRVRGTNLGRRNYLAFYLEPSLPFPCLCVVRDVVQGFPTSDYQTYLFGYNLCPPSPAFLSPL